MTTIKCENCDFWNQLDEGLGGACKRFPPNTSPQPVQMAGQIQIGQRPSPVQFMDVVSWPKTKADDWCGEFQCEKKEESEKPD